MARVTPGFDNLWSLWEAAQKDMKDLLVFYGEDPAASGPDEFFTIIHSINVNLLKCQKDIERKKAADAKKQQMQEREKEKQDLAASKGHAGGPQPGLAIDDIIASVREGALKPRRAAPGSQGGSPQQPHIMPEALNMLSKLKKTSSKPTVQ